MLFSFVVALLALSTADSIVMSLLDLVVAPRA